MVSKDLFETVVAIVGDKSIKPEKTSTTNEKLLFYALYKQATLGNLHSPFLEDDIETDQRPKSRPGFLDVTGRSKYDAWAKQNNKSKEEARKEYVELAASIVGQPVKDVM